MEKEYGESRRENKELLARLDSYNRNLDEMQQRVVILAFVVMILNKCTWSLE